MMKRFDNLKLADVCMNCIHLKAIEETRTFYCDYHRLGLSVPLCVCDSFVMDETLEQPTEVHLTQVKNNKKQS